MIQATISPQVPNAVHQQAGSGAALLSAPLHAPVARQSLLQV